MCERLQTGKISVDFERDTPVKATEVVIINRDRVGEERQAVLIYCYDDGRIEGGMDLYDGEALSNTDG